MPLQGLIAAPHTPMTTSGDICVERIPTITRHLIDSGVRGVFINGTTGEGMALTIDERKRAAEAWAASPDTRLPVVVHIGAQSLRESVELARHAATLDVLGIAAMAPAFYRPASPEDLLAFLGPIAAAAPSVPFYYYHLPGMTGVSLPAHDILTACAEGIPNFAGMKFTDPDLFAYQRCQLLAGDRLELAFGVDELLLSGLALGASAAVGSTYNYAAPIYLEMMDAFAQGDLDTARVKSQQATRLVSLLLEYGVLTAGKALMELHGIDCGPVRPPMRNLTPSDRQALLQRARALEIPGVEGVGGDSLSSGRR